jgi:transposase
MPGRQPANPTASETSLAGREQIIALTAQGQSASAIAGRMGCSVRTVHRWRARYRAAGLQPRSRRPRRPHPQTTPAAVVACIRTIRAAHPGWGARLIRRQLMLEQSPIVPSERTIGAWLTRLGFGPVRPQAGKRLGWRPPDALPSNARWQLEHKQKGGAPT